MLIFVLFAFFIHWGEFLKILNFLCINNDDYSVLKKNLPDSLPINEEHKKKKLLQRISCFLSSFFFLTNLQFLHFPEEYFFLIICRLTTFLDYTRMLAYLAFFGYIHQEIEASLSTAITGKIKNTLCLTKHILYSASEKY